MSASPPAPPRTWWRDRAVAVAVLVAVWTLLWGVFTWATLLSGIVIAVVVLVAFPLPPVTYGGRPHPAAVLRLVGRFVYDLVVASVQLAVHAVRFGPELRGAIIRVPLRVRSDLTLTLTGEAVSLVPGSLIVDADKASTTLYIHVFGVSDPAAVERFRRSVYDVEARIVRAIGSDDEIRRLDQPVPGQNGEVT